MASHLSDVWFQVTDLQVISGRGSWVTTADGAEYLDFSSGIAVTSTGHCHPKVVAAIQEQATKFIHAQVNVYRHPLLEQLADKLAEITPDGVDRFFFANSGAEATEGAVKLAKQTTGRPNTIVFQGSFHGRTHQTMAMTTSKTSYRAGHAPLPSGIFVAPFPVDDAHADWCLEQVRFLLKAQTAPAETAAIVIEPELGEGGYLPAPVAFLRGLEEICREHGILFVADEVQTGFGRTGEWFAVDHYGVTPDIMAMGKAIANGLPLSAVGARADLADAWSPGSHGTTFGGNPVCCAAAVATMDTLATVLPGVADRSTHSFDRFATMQSDLGVVGDVRGLGLMIGIDLVGEDGHSPDPGAYEHLKSHCLAEGMLLLNCGPDGNVIRFIPPLNVSMEDLDLGLDIIEAGLRSYEG
jgi:4-aminobutyrate aminotransferase